MKSTSSCSFPSLIVVLSFWGYLHVPPVDGQVAPVGPVTPIVEPIPIVRGPVDIGGNCMVDQPCKPWENFGYYAHPTNCSKYFQCESSRIITGDSCPPDKLWNNETRKCVNAEEAVCQQGCPPGSESRPNVTTTTVAPEVYKISNNCEVLLPCDPRDNLSRGHYANPDNCQEYFVCQGGNLSRVECQGNQYYDPSEGCTDRGTDGCLERDQCPTGSRMKQNNTMSSTTPTTTTTTSSPNVPVFTGPCDPPEVCTPGEKRYHPVSGHCGEYFECTDTHEWVMRECPPKFLFNASVRECSPFDSFQDLLDCPVGCPTAPIDQTDQVTQETVNRVVNIGINCQIELPCYTQIKEAFRFIAHPDNCLLYWTCDRETGNLTLIECPTDSFFNPSIRNCVRLQENTEPYCQCGCPEGSNTIQITSTTTTAISTTTTETSPLFAPRDDETCNKPERCKPGDSYANPEDCSKYYFCLTGNGYIERSCAPLNFDAEEKKCKLAGKCHPPCTTFSTPPTTTGSTESPKCASFIRVVSSNETTTMPRSFTTTTTSTIIVTSQNTASNSPMPPFTTTTEAQVPPPPPPPPPPPSNTTTDSVSTTTFPMPTTTTTNRASTTTTTAAVTDSSGRNTTDNIPSNSSMFHIEKNSTTTTETPSVSSMDPQVTTKQPGPLLDPVDEDITETSINTLNELSTTLNPSETVTNKEPHVTSDGILLPSEFVSQTYGMNLSSSISTNFTVASLTQVVDSSSTASIIPSVSKIDPNFQSSQVVPTEDATIDNNSSNSDLMTTTTTMFNSHSEVITQASLDQLSSSSFQTHSSLYDTTTLHPTYNSYSSVERVMTSSQYDMSTTDMVSSLDLTASHSHTDNEKTNVVSDGTVSNTEVMTSTESSYISDHTGLKTNTLVYTSTTQDITTTQSSDFSTIDITMSSGSDHSSSSFISSTLPSTLGTDQTTDTFSSGQFSGVMTPSETSTSETETSSYTELAYSSPKTTPELSTEQTVSESRGTTETTFPSASFTDSSTLFSPDYELTTSVPSSSSHLDGLDVTTELIISGSTVSEDMNAEPTIATNLPLSTAASASVDSGGVLGNDQMTSPSDQDTSTPGVGPSVTEPIYCEPEIAEGISWQRTQAGDKDKKPCPDERKGSAIRECGYSSSRGVGLWAAPNFELCADLAYTELVLDLESKISDPLNVTPMVYRNLTMQLEKLTVTGTDQPDGISPGNLDATVDALTLLVNLSTSQGQVLTMENAQSLVETASTLLSSDNMDSWDSVLEEDEDKAVSLMSTLDQFGHQVAKMVPPGKNQTIRTENIVIQANSVSTDIEAPVIFGENPSKLKSVSDSGDNSVRQGIILEPETIENIAEVVPGDHLLIWSSHYKTLNDLLPESDNELVNSDVMSLTIDGLPEGTIFEPGIRITFAMQNSSMKDYRATCSFWKYHSLDSGEWSSEGIKTVSYNKSGVHCECNHLTNFAVLISPYVAEGLHGDILTLITTIGCLLSIVGCTITICLYCLCWKRVKSHHAAVLLNLCFILIIGNVLFLVGIDRTKPEVLCTIIAVGLHYIWLVAFFIMLADGIEFILYVVYVFHVKRRTETFLLLFTAYIVPAVIVGISASVTMLKGYGDEKACWLSWDNGLIFAFIIPAVVIILVNFCILIKILCTAGNSEGAKQSDRSRIRATIWNIAVILPLLGIGWIFGIFSLDEDTLVFQYLFAICSSLQGFAIFIFHCILNKKLRDAVGQRFSSGWSSAGSYKSSKSVKCNRSDRLVKKMIKRDKAKNGDLNKGYLTNDSQENGRGQVSISYDGHMEPESPTPETKLQHSYDDLHHRNSAVRYQNGGLRHTNGGAQHLYQKNPSTPQITPRLPHKSMTQKTPEETSVSSLEYQFHIADNASTYMVLEPEYLDPNELGCYNDQVYPSSKPTFRSSGIVIFGYDENDLSQETGSI